MGAMVRFLIPTQIRFGEMSPAATTATAALCRGITVMAKPPPSWNKVSMVLKFIDKSRYTDPEKQIIPFLRY